MPATPVQMYQGTPAEATSRETVRLVDAVDGNEAMPAGCAALDMMKLLLSAYDGGRSEMRESFTPTADLPYLDSARYSSVTGPTMPDVAASILSMSCIWNRSP